MDGRLKSRKINLLLGCGLIILLVSAGITITLSVIIDQIWDETRFPGASEIVGHTGYTFKPSYIRLEQAFRSEAELAKLHAWYQDRFQLTVQEHSDDCVVMGSSQKRFIITRTVFVSMCRTSNKQEIYITRLISGF